jgi:hypothetical protein
MREKLILVASGMKRGGMSFEIDGRRVLDRPLLRRKLLTLRGRGWGGEGFFSLA